MKTLQKCSDATRIIIGEKWISVGPSPTFFSLTFSKYFWIGLSASYISNSLTRGQLDLSWTVPVANLQKLSILIALKRFRKFVVLVLFSFNKELTVEQKNIFVQKNVLLSKDLFKSKGFYLKYSWTKQNLLLNIKNLFKSRIFLVQKYRWTKKTTFEGKKCTYEEEEKVLMNK